jgi:leader peptidase (prepilin peptidase)/N-methyltransferase
MEIFLFSLICLMIFMFGAALGSFFNVILCRGPKKEDFIKTRSYCPECGHVLNWYELVPVVSFIVQKRRCRKCMCRIKLQYLLMEVLCGGSALWAFMTLVEFSNFGIESLTYEVAIALLLFPVLVSLSVEDIKVTEIPYWCTGTIAVLGVIATVLSVFMPTKVVWYEHLIGMVVIALPFAVFCYLGAMGGGDVQLTAAAGLLLGWAIVPAVFIAMIIGGVFGVAVKISKKRAVICFGPFLSVGIAVGYLYGYEIIHWYSNLMAG